jgi:hypothetical protein
MTGAGGTGGGAVGCARAPEIFANPMVCGGAACHGVPGQPFALPWVDLVTEPATLATRLSTTMGKGSTECAPFLVLDLANPAGSLLLSKLNDADPCGEPMPFSDTYVLTEVDRQCINEWVLAQGSTP